MSYPAYVLPKILKSGLELKVLEFKSKYGKVKLEVPKPKKNLLKNVIETIKTTREQHLVKTSVYDILNGIEKITNLWLNPDYELRNKAEEMLPIITGFSRQMISASLDGIMSRFRKYNLQRMLTSEIGDIKYLDGLAKSESGKSKAFGPELIVSILAGNVPGPQILTIVNSLLLKSAVLCKPPTEEPLLTALYAQSLADIDEKIAESIAVVPWEGGKAEYQDLENFVFGERTEREAIIIYGSEMAIKSVRERVNPDTRFISYGHKLGFAVIGKEMLTKHNLEELTFNAAYDASMFDQQGCFSPHCFYVERGGEITPEDFCKVLSQKMEELNRIIPRGEVPFDSSAMITELMTTYELQELVGGTKIWRFSSGAVVYEENRKFEPSCLYRIIKVKPIDDILEVPDLVKPFSNYLQTVGVALSEPRKYKLAEELGKLGACRFTTLGKMNQPSVAWHHDGRYNTLDLIRWIDIEQ